MSMPPLNLASRPFRNERLAALLIALGFTAAGAVSVRHAIAVRSLMPGRTSGLARQVQHLEEERSRLRAEASSLRAPRPEPGTVAQWVLLKDLVDRRTFAWSDLFRVLEETLPRNVRLDNIAPSVQKGEITVDLTAMARSNEDALELITALQKRPEFADVLPLSRSGEQQIRVQITMKYLPPRTPSVAMAEATTTVAPPAGPMTAASPATGPTAPGDPASPGAASPARASSGSAPSPAAAVASPSGPPREAPVAAAPGQENPSTGASPAAQPPGGPRAAQRRPPARPRTPPAPEGLH